MEATLPHGIRARAFRDGMIAFVLGSAAPAYDDDFSAWLEAGVRLMNAHLACLSAAIGNPADSRCAVVTPWTAMQVKFETGSFTGMTDASTGGTMFALYDARRVGPVMEWDWRYDRARHLVITSEQMERSFELLHDLLGRTTRDEVLLRADLLLRAKAAHLDLDPSGALTNAWTAIEGMLGDLFGRYLDEHKDRPTGDAQTVFINSDRRKFLEGADITSRHLAEFLSLVDRLPFNLYRVVLQSAKARNAWLHSETAPSFEQARDAIDAAGELFELLEGVPLALVTRSA